MEAWLLVRGKLSGEVREKIRRDFIKHVRWNGFDGDALKRDTPNLPAAAWELAARLRHVRADVVLCHGYKSNLVGRFASHALDILDFLLGPIASAAGDAANQAKLYEAEDVVTGNWRHQSGVMGAGAWCFTAHDRVDRCEIVERAVRDR